MRTRRRRSSIPGSRGTVAEGSVEDSIDPEEEGLEDDLNQRVADGARTEPDSPDYTPANRVEEVRNRASEYEREYRLRLLHRMLMRGIPLDTIASELQVSISTVIRDRKTLYKQLRKEAGNLDANTMIGDTLGFYNEVQGMAMKAASQSGSGNNKVPLNHKLQALRTGLSARNDRHRFLQAAGVFDVLQYKPADKAADTGLDRLMALTEKLLAQDDEIDEMASKHGLQADDVFNQDEDDELLNSSYLL